MTAAWVPFPPAVNYVRMTVGFTGPDPTPNSVEYSPPPFDVTSRRSGLPAAAFTGVPLDI